jgi:hypothetical protein
MDSELMLVGPLVLSLVVVLVLWQLPVLFRGLLLLLFMVGCDEYSLATVHCKTLYMYSLLIPIRAFPSDGRTTWVRRYWNIHKGSYAYCTTSNSRYVQVRTVNLTSQMTRLSEVSDTECAAS